jgi:hypothetical protein
MPSAADVAYDIVVAVSGGSTTGYMFSDQRITFLRRPSIGARESREPGSVSEVGNDVLKRP